MISTILVANRGEIARRIFRTCRKMGYRTVAVYSEADATSPHVREADHAVMIGAAPARASYLRVDAIIDAALRSGADAIHPGYGFLSEKPQLAIACAANGITFIGPSPQVIEQMGSKIGAKRLALTAGVPVIPGFDKDNGDDRVLLDAAPAVGFPLLVKASGGGGGKGMRAVHRIDDLASAISAARAEALASFGDDRLLIERLVARPRHIEVQIAADAFGNVIHLGDRDCSVQRNNQKVFEEAPAPNLDEATRAIIIDGSIQLAKSIGYTNLGTMEFLYDSATSEFFFLEMNTRLQVEHTVTEAVTGLDLVELQLQIASGDPLPRQEDIRLSGHAIEARLTAERPEANYMPAIGKVLSWLEPRLPGVRIDSAIEAGSEIGVHYDSMIAKVIASGADREEALRKLRIGLEKLVALGVDTNRAFLLDILKSGPFVDGVATTGAVSELFPDGWTRPAPNPEIGAAIAGAVFLRFELDTRSARGMSPWYRLNGFRSLPTDAPAVAHFTAQVAGETIAVSLDATGNRTDWIRGNERQAIDVHPVDQGYHFRFGAADGFAAIQNDQIFLASRALGEATVVVKRCGSADAASTAEDSADTIIADMPGVVAEVKAVVGDEVETGSPVIVLESMKLLVTLTATRRGTVESVDVEVGETVSAGKTLLRLAPIEK